MPLNMSRQQLKKLYSEVKHYYWDEPILFRHCVDQVSRRCVPEEEMISILTHCHTLHSGDHFGGTRTVAKVLQCGFYWSRLFKYASAFVKSCDRCQKTGNISRRDQMPMTGILEVEFSDVWGMDFMGPFMSSFNNQYIMLVVEYVSKWVEATTTRTSDGKRALFYHSLANGQAEVSNWEIKSILEKTVKTSRKDWSKMLDDSLWAYRTVFKTPIGQNRHMELNKLDEFQNEAYGMQGFIKKILRHFMIKGYLGRISNREIRSDLCEVWEVPTYPSDIYRKAMGPVSCASVFKFNEPSLELPVAQPRQERVEEKGDHPNEPSNVNVQQEELSGKTNIPIIIWGNFTIIIEPK
ncbi:uncharacterized protein LOC133823978 [Humulus lupulus]|uniref:uncharacterized protein LOC133823978 n=1 Tax=Humulus lupulus TaxID=3486 RepID=UPI002B41366A|nr:uncharacterized protein LOC133823978 [Humulus lupulus]